MLFSWLVCVYTTYVYCPGVSEEGVGLPGIGVTDCFESLCRNCDSNPGPLSPQTQFK